MLRLRIKEVMEERGISQGKLSRESKVPLNLIGRMVNDPHYMPSSATLYKVAQFLQMHMEELLVDEDAQIYAAVSAQVGDWLTKAANDRSAGGMVGFGATWLAAELYTRNEKARMQQEKGE